MALALTGSACGTVYLSSPSSVSAIGIFPVAIEYTLDDDVFVINREDKITVQDLEDHGLKLKQINDIYHDMPEDPEHGKTTQSETELETYACTFEFPETFVIGQNKIHVTHEPAFGVPGSLNLLETDIEITVNFFDNTVNNKVTDTNAEPAAPEYGEINGDGIVDMTDLSELSLYLLHEKELDDTQKANADADGNGDIDLADLSLMKQYISGSGVKLGKR